jgi:hypothetical protein
MDKRTLDRLKLLRSKKFSVPGVVGIREDPSGALRVGKDQINDANDFAESVGCGTPFGSDGKPVMDRNQKKKYMEERNKQAADLGQPPIVNFDGGYGDAT